MFHFKWIFAFIFLILLSKFVFAASGGHNEIPYKTIMFQCINFSIFVGLLFFGLRKKVIVYFRDRHLEYQQALEKAQVIQREAEQKHLEVKERLNLLEASTEDKKEQIQKEAQEIKQRIIMEAQILCDELINEASKVTQLEIERAKLELREFVLKESMMAAKEAIKIKMDETKQQELVSQFAESIKEG